MLFMETKIRGAYVIEPSPIRDHRGCFSRMFCAKEFNEAGLEYTFPQCNLSYNHHRHTLRGMHYQADPYGEVKLVSCVKGRVLDVVVDLRKESPDYCKWVSVELDASRHNMIYIPKGLAHGYLTLTEGAEVFYQVSEYYNKEAERGVCYNDPLFAIEWGLSAGEMPTISDRDLNHPRYIS